MKLKENYPNNVSFYLEENKASPIHSFSFIEEELEQKNRNLSKNEKKQIMEKNKFDKIKKETIFRYFHPQFKKKLML